MQTNGICGPKPCGSCESCDPIGHVLRTFLASKLSELTGSVKTWKKAATPSGRSWWVLTTVAPPTGGSGCSSWPTVTASDAQAMTPAPRPSRAATNRKTEYLARMVQWPTATAGDANSSGSRNLEGSNAHPGTSLTDAVRPDRAAWPTPKAADGRSKGTGGSPDHGLDAMARSGLLFPTPSARDWKDGRASQGTMERNSRPLDEFVVWATPQAHDARRPALGLTSTQGSNLSRDVGRLDPDVSSTPGSRPVLSPDWVEALMGFPPGWTRLPDDTVSKPSATPSSLVARK